MVQLKIVQIGNPLEVRPPRGVLNRMHFGDGNKRVLARNGCGLAVGEADATRAVLDLASGAMSEDAFTRRLTHNTEKL